MENFAYSKKVNSPVSFNGKMIPIKHFDTINTIVNCRVSDMASRFKPNMKSGFIEHKADEVLIENVNCWNDFIKGLKYPLTDLPLDVYEGAMKCFGKNPLKSGIIASRNDKKLRESQERVLRGLYEHGDRFVEEALAEAKEKNIHISTDTQDPGFVVLCDKVTEKFYNQLNKNFAPSKMQYNTTTERTQVRLVSGGIAALALYIDFYNKNIRDGASHAEADKQAKTKFKQEFLATAGEAEAQYLTLSGFQRFANNSQFGAPIINTAIGLFLHIASRLYTGQPLKRVEEKPKLPKKINYFDLLNEAKKPKETLPPKDKEGGGRILTLKNIGIACLSSISIGFGLRYSKIALSNSRLSGNLRGFSPFKKVIDLVDKIKEKYSKSVIGEVWMSADKFADFAIKLEDTKNNRISNYYKKKTSKLYSKISLDSKLFLGEYKKTIKIPFTNIHLIKQELIKLPLVPFKLLYEIASYPYKAALKVCEEAKIVKKIKKKEDGLKDPLNMVNIIRDYQTNLERFKNKEDFNKFYEKRLEKGFEDAVNCETKSGVDNAKIGKLTQILGTVMSIYFATTDDYNRTILKTSNKEQAQMDARERGINKFLRIVSQIAILDAILGVCKFAYARSLPLVCAITALCTVLTDVVSRVLSGMPFMRVKNKAEFDKYQQEKKNNGISGAYFKLIDGLKQ